MLNLANKFTGLLTAFLQIKFYDPNIIYLRVRGHSKYFCGENMYTPRILQIVTLKQFKPFKYI